MALFGEREVMNIIINDVVTEKCSRMPQVPAVHAWPS